jgi:hypothetical protein
VENPVEKDPDEREKQRDSEHSSGLHHRSAIVVARLRVMMMTVRRSTIAVSARTSKRRLYFSIMFIYVPRYILE